MPHALKVVAQGDTDIVMTRAFDAPRALVFEALTRPELLRRWLLGPEGWSMPRCDYDFRVGGAYAYHWAHADGRTMSSGGVFREISPPGRLVQTEQFYEPWYEGESLVTWELVETGGRTLLTSTQSFADVQTRDAVIASGMESGVGHSFDLLDAVLASAVGSH